MFVLSLVSAVLLAFPSITLQTECGQRLGKGAVVCSIGIHGKADNFNYSLCTHASVVAYIRCADDVCYPVSDTDFETLLGRVQPHVSTKKGLDITVDNNFKNFISNRRRRLNTRNAFFKFMSERNLTFIYFDSTVGVGNVLPFIQEIAGPMHDRGWHIGLKVNVRGGEFHPAYNFEKLSNHVDWFTFSVRKSPIAGKELWPITPLSASDPDDYIGTTKYWIERALELLKSECVVLIIDIVGIKYVAKEDFVEPGPGSKVHVRLDTRVDTGPIFFIEICYKLGVDSSCQEHWDEESSTPWAACGNLFYSYEDGRSVRAKTNLAHQYQLGGMAIYLDRNDVCEDRNPILLVKAMQGIRTDQS